MSTLPSDSICGVNQKQQAFNRTNPKTKTKTKSRRQSPPCAVGDHSLFEPPPSPFSFSFSFPSSSSSSFSSPSSPSGRWMEESRIISPALPVFRIYMCLASRPLAAQSASLLGWATRPPLFSRLLWKATNLSHTTAIECNSRSKLVFWSQPARSWELAWERARVHRQAIATATTVAQSKWLEQDAD